jgi:hypothetical protein
VTCDVASCGDLVGFLERRAFDLDVRSAKRVVPDRGGDFEQVQGSELRLEDQAAGIRGTREENDPVTREAHAPRSNTGATAVAARGDLVRAHGVEHGELVVASRALPDIVGHVDAIADQREREHAVGEPRALADQHGRRLAEPVIPVRGHELGDALADVVGHLAAHHDARVGARTRVDLRR